MSEPMAQGKQRLNECERNPYLGHKDIATRTTDGWTTDDFA